MGGHRLLLFWLLLCGASGVSKDECRAGDEVSALQRQSKHELLAQHASNGTLDANRTLKPWDLSYFVVGVHHKAGTILFMNIMGKAWDHHGIKTCWSLPSARCRVLTVPAMTKRVLDDSRHIASNAGLRVVHGIRDPATMLASAYCYHHRGSERNNPVAKWPDIMTQGPVDGMRNLLPQMLQFMNHMAEVYENSKEDVHTVRYEDFMKSSESFDQHVMAAYEYMFGDVFSKAQLNELLEYARVEDLRRATSPNAHSSSKDCEAEALKLLLVSPDLYEPIKTLRDRLDYKTALL